MRWLVVVGDPLSGFTFFGMFETAEDAGDWAANEITNETWWLAQIGQVQ